MPCATFYSGLSAFQMQNKISVEHITQFVPFCEIRFSAESVTFLISFSPGLYSTSSSSK